MDSSGKVSESTITPVKDAKFSRSSKPASPFPKEAENLNPNFKSPDYKSSVLFNKSAKKPQKSAANNPNLAASPRNKIRERRFVVAKKRGIKEKPNVVNCKCTVSGKEQKCVCVAYEKLRASQDEFFRNRANKEDDEIEEEEGEGGGEMKDSVVMGNSEALGFGENLGENEDMEKNGEEVKSGGGGGSATVKRRRDKLLEEARQSVPECGRVMHLVKAFEKMLSIQKTKDLKEDGSGGGAGGEEGGEGKKVMKWALPGLLPKGMETQVSSSSFCPSDFFLTSDSLGLDSRVGSSLDRSAHGSFTRSSRNSDGGRRIRHNSLESSGTFGGRQERRRQHKITSQKPFKLRTEQRGRSKEEEFKKKIKEMMMEEEKHRIPIAQGLPWTTDEPECLVKPPVKESTRPVDFVLHSDVRAVERAEFDHQVVEKMSLTEQYRMEEERLQKLAEEEELRRLRKELVSRAQPMPYFDRPFIPRRSEKHPTIPKEPKFHLPQQQHKKIKCCISWNDMYTQPQ